MWRYDEFLAVREDFIPVFSEEVDRNHRENWKFFIPHDHMRNLLDKLIAALERAHGGDKLSLWLTGAYGTGKTFASFVVKHLLEDPLDEIEDYFEKHQILLPLWPRFRALRERGPYLVVYRSASGHITSSRRLMIEVEQAIKDQLRDRGFTNTYGEGIMDQLVKRFTDENSVLNWEGILNKYRGRFRTFRTLDTVQEVVKRLLSGDTALCEDVATALEEEGLTLVDSPAAVKAWIKEVITHNGLQGVVLIWDEFTEFFTGNVNVPVTPLQELAHATADMPFYLFLITHRALNQFTGIDDDTRKKLADRFHNCQLEMTPVTAYKLIANVIEAHPDRREAWQAKQDTLWSGVDVAALHISLLGERVQKNELKKLIPIHPFTAYLLATISSLYSSSQRTLFQFMKKSEPGSFQWFIASYPSDNWYWLTPDYLWQYFFEESKIETIDTVSDILSHCRSVENNLASEDEKRVFRVMLLLCALWRQTQGSQPLLRPSLSVLKHMFVGTDLYHRVGEVADDLCNRDIMHAVPSGNDCEYIIPTATIDHSKLQQQKRRAEANLTFEKMIDAEKEDAEFAASLKELLSLQGASKLRHPVRIVSARDLALRRERLIRGVERPYEVGVILVVAQEDEHLRNSEFVALEISKDHIDYCIVISQIAFGAKRWSEWVEYQARSWYFDEMRDSTTKQFYETRGKKVVEEWLNSVRTGRIRAFFRGKESELVGCEAIADYLENVVSSVYPYGPEKLSRIATLYAHAFGKAGAEIGLGIARNVQRPYKDVVDELKNQGLWEDDALRRSSDHPLARMRATVDSFFDHREHVSLKQLWEELQHPPYGLMPSPIGILLFAVLLRDYSQGHYYSDGVNSLPLNPNKLAELVGNVTKGIRLSENYTIRKMSIDGERFCRIAREVFRLTDEQTTYPEEARKNMRKSVMDMGYPLWTLAYYAKKALDRTEIENIARATESLGDTLAYDRDELGDQAMKEVVGAVDPIRDELSRLLSKDRMQEGMKHFWETHAPQLIALMESLRLDAPQVMDRLRTLLNEDVYLWREDRVKEKLPDMVRELDLIDALNSLFGVVKQDLNSLRGYFRDSWFKSKLPLLCYKEGESDEVAGFIDYLHQLVYHPDQSIIDDRADDIRRFGGHLTSLLSKSAALVGDLAWKLTGQALSDDEEADLYGALPDLASASEEEVKRAIVHALSQQAKQKKLADLRRRWQTLTGSESPERWSEERRTPIHWVLEGQIHHTFLTRYSNLQQLSESEIDEMIAYITDHAAELTALQDHQRVLDRFVKVAAGEYSELVRQAGEATALQDHVYSALRGNVYHWPMRLGEVSQLVRKWVNEHYKTRACPQVLKVIDSIPSNDLKRLVKDLVAEDALVGARLMATIEGKNR